MMKPLRALARGSTVLRRLLGNRRGNVAILTAVIMLPTIFAIGLGLDFTLSRQRQDQINGIADAAALAAVTPNMLSQSDANAKAAATNMFDSQIALVPNVNYSLGGISITAVTSKTTLVRTVVVSYSAASNNVFGALLGSNTFPISGSSTAMSSVSPQINFYMLLDDSPSMALPTTSAGILQMEAATPKQTGSNVAGLSTPVGCAFACHQSNPSADALGNPGGEDNYALANNLGITLRIGNVNAATQTMLGTSAPQAATNNKTTYQAAIFTMDTAVHQLTGSSGNPSTAVVSLASALAAAPNILPQEVCNNNFLVCGQNNDDEDSSLDGALSTVNGYMPTPGNGTTDKGDTPQEILFIVSDGLNDYLSSGSRYYGPLNNATCTAIKNRGIRIAFLYLTYYPVTSDSWYMTYVNPIQPNLATGAESCASPGLYFQVSTDGDITSAMTTLFQKAVATARLSQ